MCLHSQGLLGSTGVLRWGRHGGARLRWVMRCVCQGAGVVGWPGGVAGCTDRVPGGLPVVSVGAGSNWQVQGGCRDN